MISVVITAYNVGEYIEQSIRSVISQTFQDLEIIVVCDRPTDNTVEVVKSIKDGRIKIIKNAENLGAGHSRDVGIKASNGEYILLLDGDDWLDNDFLERLYKSAVETDADITSGGVKLRYPDGYYEAQCCGDYISEGYEKVVKFWGLKTVFMNNRLIKRHMFDLVPYSHRRYIEDTPVIIPMLWYANKVVYVDTIGYNYRINYKSLTHTSNEFKEFLFKGLCWLDLVDFFDEHDKGLYKHLDIRKYLQTIIYQAKTIKVHEEGKYPAEWNEFTTRLKKYINEISRNEEQ